MISKEIKQKLSFPDYKIITVDEYNWLVNRMKEVKDYLESDKKELPIKIENGEE
jgi:protease II